VAPWSPVAPVEQALVTRDLGFMRIRLGQVALATALAVSFLGTSPATAGTEEGRIVFEVTLSGPVPDGESFAVSRVCPSDPSCFAETIITVCSPDATRHEPCTAKRYVVPGSAVPVGSTVEYALWRTEHHDLHAEELLRGDWAMVTGRQVIRLGYAYQPPVEEDAADEPHAPAEPVAATLPDTALAP
jgi:hypothetical protein